MYDDLVRALREIAGDDHLRGCDGRTYSCDCGFDDAKDRALSDAAAVIERLQAELAEAVANEREACARIMDERAAMYRSKAQRHAGDFKSTCTEYEKAISNAEGAEWAAAAIRERT